MLRKQKRYVMQPYKVSTRKHGQLSGIVTIIGLKEPRTAQSMKLQEKLHDTLDL